MKQLAINYGTLSIMMNEKWHAIVKELREYEDKHQHPDNVIDLPVNLIICCINLSHQLVSYKRIDTQHIFMHIKLQIGSQIVLNN